MEASNVRVSKKLRQGSVQEPSPRREADSITSPMDNHSQSPDQSCLDSPTSMLTRLELLEAQGGRKSKRLKIKSKLSITKSEAELQTHTSEINVQVNEQPVKDSPKKMHHTLSVSSTKDTGVNLITENTEEPCKHSSALVTESIDVQSVDNELTCLLEADMDLTHSVPDRIIQESNTSKVEDTECLQDEHKSTQARKRFFKSKEQELVDESPKIVERTPYDLSMLNETVGNMPPFSSVRTTEKENVQPLSCGNGGDNESVTLCDVSVVLKDFLKESMNSDTPKRSGKVRRKRHSPKCISLNSPRQPRCVSKVLQYPVDNDNSDEMWNHKWVQRKVRKKVKRQSLTAPGMSPDSVSSLELKWVKKNAAKSPSNNLDDSHSNAEDAQVINETPSPRTDKPKSPGSLIDDLPDLPHLQQQISENQREESVEMQATPDANENNADHCNSSPVTTEEDASECMT